MPMFEFMCERCGTQFEELVRSSSTIEGVVCPACDSTEVTKQISTFASKISGTSSASNWRPSAPSCNPGSL